jgi:TM2 domain-containing membrane protein YozV
MVPAGALLLLLLLASPCSLAGQGEGEEEEEECEGAINCAKQLQIGQFLCVNRSVDPGTQQLEGCELVQGSAGSAGRAMVLCLALPGILCSSSCNQTFAMEVDCDWTNGYHFDTALLLSVFLGMFGADRFYLGYPAIGLLKFSTLGFFFIGHLVDVILIASQALGPADGSQYVMDYFGAGRAAQSSVMTRAALGLHMAPATCTDALECPAGLI